MVAVEKARASSQRARALKLHELQAFFRSCQPDNLAFFTVLFFCGLRKPEIFRLRWEWIDFERDWIHIREAKRGSDEMPMAAPVRAALLALGPRAAGLVFPGRDDPDRPLVDKRWALRSALKRAGLDARAFSPHSFRHTFITFLEEISGVSYAVVRALARHGSHSQDMTTRYLQPGENRLRSALAALAERVLGEPRVVPIGIAVGE